MKILSSKFNLAKLLDADQQVVMSFVNLYSVGQVLKMQALNKVVIYSGDGFLLNVLLGMIYFKKVERISFDFTSIADCVISKALKEKREIIFVGGKANESEDFKRKIKGKYSSLKIKCMHGYVFDEQYDDVIKRLSCSDAGYIVAGMGGGLQEKFISDLYHQGFKGHLFTCGGFISQTAMSESEVYYPKMIDKFNLRAFYRMYREPHTIKRYCIDYPRNALLVIKTAIVEKEKIVIV
ncbi:WecB/TagA/CpsF family glycosyltransferase [Neptunomonas sp. CHC150]|uniref:WecB/TagA/CpsF family glycosyltransferase n=1 Tax=Neptunomonas sp. CHC150 TaxID=2998324 RepID=UPI0025AF83F9|nr:WecB/TagA/CpsF family glycosyltransferase [Neptunomonas sp. CHC150]MDN2661076.1 WecB/TagA/CpsF family glycosyltransferase [Neptunomonas sp. CHC150]